MSQLRSNSDAFIHDEQYSAFILETLHDQILTDVMYRNVSDFGSGTTLRVKTTGVSQLQNASENTPLTYTALANGEVTLTITEHVGDAWFVSDELREDGSQIDQLQSIKSAESARAIAENFETTFFQACNDVQTAGDPNNINDFSHRFQATGTNDTMTIDDIITMQLAFNKANVPNSGRIAIVDPVVSASLNKLYQGTYAVNSNPAFQPILETGFAKENRFIMNLMGFDFYTSNRLPRLAAGTSVDGTDTVQANGGVANIFMCIADDSCKPVMGAWRRPPRMESERNKDNGRDEHVVTARWGFGAQREETVGIIQTDAQAY